MFFSYAYALNMLSLRIKSVQITCFHSKQYQTFPVLYPSLSLWFCSVMISNSKLGWWEEPVEVPRKGVELFAPCIETEGPELLPPVATAVSAGRAMIPWQCDVQEEGNHSCHCCWGSKDHLDNVVKLQMTEHLELFMLEFRQHSLSANQN